MRRPWSESEGAARSGMAAARAGLDSEEAGDGAEQARLQARERRRGCRQPRRGQRRCAALPVPQGGGRPGGLAPRIAPWRA
jgi:hypothetical protein